MVLCKIIESIMADLSELERNAVYIRQKVTSYDGAFHRPMSFSKKIYG